MKLENEQHPGIDALERVTLEILRADGLPARFEVHAYTWRDRDGGLRLAELGYTDGSGGGSWMQGDLDAAAVCFAAERYMLDHDQGPEDMGGVVYDAEQEARRGLWHALTGEMPEWEERPACQTG